MIIRLSQTVSRRLRPNLSTPLCAPSARAISSFLGASQHQLPITASAASAAPPLRRQPSISNTNTNNNNNLPHNQIAVRFHRTDYEGPGKFGERETGSMFGKDEHDHSHAHGKHRHQEEEQVGDEEKQRIQQLLQARYTRRSGNYEHRGFTIGIGGPVGSGKTALTLALCRALRDKLPMGVVTNDIFTQEDAEFLARENALDKSRIMPVETGGCPHAAIREDVSANLGALELLTRKIKWEDEEANNAAGNDDANTTTAVQGDPLLLCESGGDNLAANFSSELADYTIYVIDVAGGDKVPRKGGPGITQSDLLVINKIDLAEAVGASLDVMERDAGKMRKGVRGGESGPTIFASVKNGVGVDDIIGHIMKGFDGAHQLVERAA